MNQGSRNEPCLSKGQEEGGKPAFVWELRAGHPAFCGIKKQHRGKARKKGGEKIRK